MLSHFHRPVRAFLVALFALGVAASGAIAWARHRVEAGYRTVEIVIDGEDWDLLARRQGLRPDELWPLLRASGATGVAVYEQTLRRLATAGRLTTLEGAALRDQARLGRLLPPLADLARRPDAVRSVYVLPEGEEVASLVRRGFTTVLGPERIREVSRRPLVYEVRGWRKDLEEVPLGFLPSAVHAWERRGLVVVLRPRNARSLDAERLRQRVLGYGAFGRGRTFIFEGSEVLGYEHLIPEAAAALRQIGGIYGRVEVLTVARRFRGEQALAHAMAPAVVRVFSIGSDELFRITPQEARDRFLRAARERNLRVLYVRPFHSAPGGTDPVAYNLHYLQSIAAGLRTAGFRLGTAAPLPVVEIPRALVGLALIGALAAFTLLGLSFRPARPAVTAALLFLGCLGVVFVVGVISSVWMRKLTALAAAIAVPTLAVHAGLPRRTPQGPFGRVLAASVVRLWGICLVSAAGGLVVAALLTQWRFMTASDGFFGVKLATAIPLLLVALLWLAEEDGRVLAHRLWDLTDRPLSLRVAVLVVAVGAVAVLLLLRTGNTSLPVFAGEERLRNALEDALVARPRTKEYLVGHPAMLCGIAMMLWGARRWALPLVVLGTVGQVGLVNSFSHLHTPILYTVWRTANGLVLGTAVGSVAVCGLWLLARRGLRGTVPDTQVRPPVGAKREPA